MQNPNKINFKMMSFIHETLYGIFRDPYQALQAAGLIPGQRVLEVGCGPGFFTIPAASIVGGAGSVTALDVNPLAVEHVRLKVKEQDVNNIEVLLGNVTQADLQPQSFDLIFLFGLAHPIGDVESILEAAHRLLKQGGTLSIEGRLRPPERIFQLVKRQGRIAQYRRVGHDI
jgi:ubiquinone/menaquinone biosynthesis C-methylase UbiE